jgi:hypothetical protein
MLIMPCFFIVFEDLYSQDYAGPDKHICLGSTTPIGNTGVSGACYAWTPETGLSNPHSPNPIASPETTTSYTVVVVGPNFSFTAVDQMTVVIESQILGFEITPKKCCWKVGQKFKEGSGKEAITSDQFEIRTIPPGLEGQIQNILVTPNQVPYIVNGATEVINVEVAITYECNNFQETLISSIPITIVDENFEVSFSESLELDNIDVIEKFLKKVMKTLKFAPVCEPSATWNLEGSTAISLLCCDGKAGCVKESLEKSGSIAASAGITCDFPFPPIPVLNIRVLGSAGIDGSLSFKTQCEDIVYCITLQGSASVGGGISAGNENVIMASLVIVGTIELPPLKFCIPPGNLKLEGEVCFFVEVVGTVQYFSFYEQSISFTLINNWCPNLW